VWELSSGQAHRLLRRGGERRRGYPLCRSGRASASNSARALFRPAKPLSVHEGGGADASLLGRYTMPSAIITPPTRQYAPRMKKQALTTRGPRSVASQESVASLFLRHALEYDA